MRWGGELCGQPWIDTVAPAVCEPRRRGTRAVSAVWGGARLRVHGDTIEVHGRLCREAPLFTLRGVLGFWPWAASRLPSGAAGGPVVLHDRGEAVLAHMGFGHYVLIDVRPPAAYWFRLRPGEPLISHAYYEAWQRRRVGPFIASSASHRYVVVWPSATDNSPRLLRRRRGQEGWLRGEDEEEDAEEEDAERLPRLAPGSVWSRAELRMRQQRRRAATVARIMHATALDADCLWHVVSRMM